MQDIIEHSQRQIKINEELMQKEIDDFISKSIKEMNDAIEELRISYNNEFVEIDGKKDYVKIENVFPDLLVELKNDLENEIEILTEKYEELRTSETKRIFKKYSKKNE